MRWSNGLPLPWPNAHPAWYDSGGTSTEAHAMGSTMKELGIDRLSAEQRVALALEIWESLGEARPAGRLSAEQRTELARRDTELEANPSLALNWEEIRAG